MKKLCIYHNNCPDGFGAAWVVRRKFGEENVEFYGATHGDAPPDCTGKDVIIVDFSYPMTTLIEMETVANSMTILDHHKSAKDNVEYMLSQGLSKGIFDETRSGVGLAWDYYFPGVPIPMVLHHIQYAH